MAVFLLTVCRKLDTFASNMSFVNGVSIWSLLVVTEDMTSIKTLGKHLSYLFVLEVLFLLLCTHWLFSCRAFFPSREGGGFFPFFQKKGQRLPWDASPWCFASTSWHSGFFGTFGSGKQSKAFIYLLDHQLLPGFLLRSVVSILGSVPIHYTDEWTIRYHTFCNSSQYCGFSSASSASGNPARVRRAKPGNKGQRS